MSTHCGIAIKTEKGYETIYCHWNGYPEYMLPMLNNNYKSEELAKKLISFGDASSISERLEPIPGSIHSFDHPELGVCVFYGRDRGEELTMAQVYPTKEDLLDTYYFAYIFEDGSWNCYQNDED